jgi:ribosomal protein L14
LTQGIYKFELNVTDNSGASARDTVWVTVNAAPAAANQAPKANAGSDITITLPTSSVTLSGSGTDADGTIASYRWANISGPKQATISSPNRASTTTSNLAQGIYKFQLTVTDNLGAIGRDTLQVTVNAAPQAPKANAGADKKVTLPTNSVTLSGSGTDPDGTITSYQWKKVSGPSQYNVTSSTSAQTSVNNLAQGTYKFELKVTDNSGRTATDTVQVEVSSASAAVAPNKAPVANAGLDLNITLPTNSVIFSGSGSDPDGTIAAYKWTKISGPSQFSIVSSTKAQTTVNNLSQGIYQFELTVTDNAGATATDVVQVTVNAAASPTNQSPKANAGSNLTITLPTNSVTLSGSGTDADGTIASYKWAKTSGPSTYTIVSSTTAQTQVDNLVQGTYQFELTVTDNSGATAKGTVQVTVNPAPLSQNKAPEASAGSDLVTMLPMDTITLTGTGSDEDGTIASYKWTKISGPSQFSIVSPSKSRTLVKSLKEGLYQFELTVTDNAGASAKDTVELAVVAAAKSLARVFPNPATNVINIQIEPTTKTSNAALRVYDNKGILVYQEDFVRQQQGMIKQVSISKLPSGIYFAELQTDINNIITLRFMKK